MAKKKRHKQRPNGWDRVIEPQWLPDCPICESYKAVERAQDDSLIYYCLRCQEDFVVYDTGDSIPVGELHAAHKWVSKAKAPEPKLVGTGKYKLGDMVEEHDYAGN